MGVDSWTRTAHEKDMRERALRHEAKPFGRWVRDCTRELVWLVTGEELERSR